MTNNLKKNKLSFGVYRILLVALSFLGLYASMHLAYTHYANYNILSYQSFCALSKTINCDSVAQSEYAVFAGIPVAVWGIIGYIFTLFLLIMGFFSKAGNGRFISIFFVLAILFSLQSMIFGYISLKFVNSLCILCLLSYAVNFLLVLISWMAIKRYEIKLWSGLRADFLFVWNNRKITLPTGLLFIVVITTLILFYPPYWEFRQFPKASLFDQGVTDEGHPWIGASEPILTITEFADYQCFPCKKVHLAIRQLMQHYPDKIRLVHRHFPMGTQCNPIVKEAYHEAACTMALIAIAAGQNEKFWPVSDSLFYSDPKSKNLNIKKMVESVGLNYAAIRSSISKKETMNTLLEDIRDGLQLGIRETPGILVRGKLYPGWIPPEVLNQYLAELEGIQNLNSNPTIASKGGRKPFGAP
jgi:protein-disulfide isomerase/uncharacterized membrane protein